MSAEHRLPAALLERASLRGNEYAWSIGDIPEVIEAARLAGLVNVGGQLPFRAPGATTECYWIDVDPLRSLPENLPSQDRIIQSAERAHAGFARLLAEVDFIAEGRNSFAQYFDDLERRGQDPAQFACFVWYVKET